MLTEITLRNFRCFGEKDAKIPLAPLTILTGLNGAGKSTVLAAIRPFAAQEPEPSVFRGFSLEPGASNHPRDFHRHDLARDVRLTLTQSLHVPSEEHRPGSIDHAVARDLARGVTWRLEVRGDRPRRILHSLDTADGTYGELTIEATAGAHSGAPQCRLSFGAGMSCPVTPAWGWERAVRVHAGTFEVGISQAADATPAGSAGMKGMAGLALAVSKRCARGFEQIRFLSSLRGDVPADAVMAEPAMSVGDRGQFVLQRLAGTDRIRHAVEWKRIEHWLKRFGASAITTVAAGLNRVSGRFKDPKLDVAVEMALGSSGLRQMLSLIVETVLSDAGTSVLVEEPELSIHPLSQPAVADFFVEAVQSGKQVIASTHSDYLLAALHAPLRCGALRPEQLRTYEVSRARGGASVVRPFDILARGRGADWPSSWRTAEQSLNARYEDEGAGK